MYDPFDDRNRSKSGFTRRYSNDTRFDAAFVARCSVFTTLLVIGTLPLSFFFTTNFSPFIVYVLFYSVLGLVAFALRTPSCGGERGETSERTNARGERQANAASKSDTGS